MLQVSIEILNNAIIINGILSNLRPYQIAQIHSWGFLKVSENNSYKLYSENIDSILLKLLEYFKKEGIPYSLSTSCMEYVSQIHQIIKYFEKAKISGREYKDGKFDSTKFNEFLSFVNNNIPRQLKEHQLKAAFHLYLVENGANFSVPGSGKTTVIVSVYEKLKLEGKTNLLFIVGPPSCFEPWRTEFELTLNRKPDYRILAGGERVLRKTEYFSTISKKAELYLTTYQSLLNDQKEVITFFNQRGIKVFLVIDEAHYIKQIGGSWANAVMLISKYAKYRCILTGTPLPKSYTDVFNLFDFLWPYNSPIDSKMKTIIQLEEEKRERTLVKEMLQKSVGPLFYRVRKSDLGLIPPVFHPPIILPMYKHERMIYNAIDKKIRDYTKQDYLRNIDLVIKLRRGRIIRLRQCVSYAKLLSSAVDNYDENIIEDEPDLRRIICDYDSLEIPAKLEYLEKFVNSMHEKKQKVVIWANFIGTLELIIKHLTESGFYCKLIYGKTPTEQTSISEEESREKIRTEFVNPNSGLDILVANPAACAESISLHKTCYHAIYYDLSYNCAQYLQSLDRIHRVGGSENNQANYYFLQYENTIDQDIKSNLDGKARKMYDVIEEGYCIYSLDMFEEDDNEIKAYERFFGKK